MKYHASQKNMRQKISVFILLFTLILLADAKASFAQIGGPQPAVATLHRPGLAHLRSGEALSTDLEADAFAEAVVVLRRMDGSLVSRRKVVLNPGHNPLQFIWNDLEPGGYRLELQAGAARRSLHFVFH